MSNDFNGILDENPELFSIKRSLDMGFNYISGFFDADGSISLLSIHKNEHKTIQVSFCNNEIRILEVIKNFLFEEIQIKGAISRKRARKNTHSTNYELKYTRNYALKLIKQLHSFHPKKRHRIQVALKYYLQVTRRNGKYDEKALRRKEAFNRLFYWEGQGSIPKIEKPRHQGVGDGAY